MSTWMGLPMMGLPILGAAMAMILGCSPQPSATIAMIEDKAYGAPPVEDDPYTEEGGEG